MHIVFLTTLPACMSAAGENLAAITSSKISVLLLGVVKHGLIDGVLYCRGKHHYGRLQWIIDDIFNTHG